MPTQNRALDNVLAPQLPSLDQQPNDILLLIVDLVAPMPRPRRNSKPPIHELSLVSKRMRELCTPVLFQKVKCWCDERTLYDRLSQMQKSPVMAHLVE